MDFVRKVKTCVLIVYYCSHYLLTGVIGQAVITTVCPERFPQGVVSTVTCHIDRAAVTSAGCPVQPSTVVFGLLKSAGEFDTLCSTSYPGSCSSASDGNCGCVSSVGGTNTYQLLFTANENEHRGGSLSCSINCASVPPLSTNVTAGCQSITVVTTTTTKETTATTEKVITTVTTTTTARTANGTTTTTEMNTTTIVTTTTVLPEPLQLEPVV
ncbi:uncharacterized protein LOC112568363 [Pomacea canaliculata]|uniref:uncharacterized protein LOC112568363 n=1 Tax=Pomacea canaliculata TaxID=400727 RepID=UPI000D737F3A|nr:uncharacterized protein LOC112568363 [Pomacea canaliculata]